MKITTGNLEVYQSGVVESQGTSDINFILVENPRMVITIRVATISSEEPAIEWKVDSPDRLVITIKNPGLNGGPSSPIQVGHINGRQLHIAFRTSIFGNISSFQITYTFYLGETVK